MSKPQQADPTKEFILMLYMIYLFIYLLSIYLKGRISTKGLSLYRVLPGVQ